MTRSVFPFLTLLLTLAPVLPGCKEQPKKAGPAARGEPAAGSEPAAKTRPEPSKIKEGTGTLCTRLEGDTCADPNESDTFGADVKEVHVVYVAPGVPRNAKNANILWIAEDVGEAAPKDYKIAAADAALKGLEQKNADQITVKGKLTRPTKGWPLGRYRVEIRLEGQLIHSKQFTIAKAGR